MVMGVSDDQILAKADLTFMTRLLINRSVSGKDLSSVGAKSRPDAGVGFASANPTRHQQMPATGSSSVGAAEAARFQD